MCSSFEQYIVRSLDELQAISSPEEISAARVKFSRKINEPILLNVKPVRLPIIPSVFFDHRALLIWSHHRSHMYLCLGKRVHIIAGTKYREGSKKDRYTRLCVHRVTDK